MTSSSDTERLCQRRISVRGLPINCPSSELRSIFSRYGGITAVHVTKQGHGFVTFDEEEAATAALSMTGAVYLDSRLTVELSQWHDSSTLPVIGAKREMYFPRPFGGRGGQTSGNTGSYRSGSGSAAASSGRPRNSSTSGQVAVSSRTSRSGMSSQRPSLANIIKVVITNENPPDDVRTAPKLTKEVSQKILTLLVFERYPEISKKIFSSLDLVSLLRCRLVSKTWAQNISNFVMNSPLAVERRLAGWCQARCSIYPLTPERLAQCDETPESRYRNVLRVKADEKEIFLALDNGNVEIYDRMTRKLSCTLAGQYSISPVGLDINTNFILVSYTCAFVNRFRMPTPSSWWSIFCRKTRKLLRVIERENVKNIEDVRLGHENFLFLTTRNSIYFIDFNAHELLRESTASSKLPTRVSSPKFTPHKIVSIHIGDTLDADTLEAVDFDTDRIIGIVKRRVDNETIVCVWKKPDFESILQKPKNQPKVDFMTRLESSFSVFGSESVAAVSPDLDLSKCACMSVQCRYPLCLVFLSNNRGLFEVLNSCRPYVIFAICDVIKETTLRILTLDCAWMMRISVVLVPYDFDTCVLTAKFNNDLLVVGFGSSSDSKDGGIAMWRLDELLNQESEPKVFTLPPPVYHWAGWDGHTGGVTDLHLDTWGLIAVNACKHQVTTRCIERVDETKKDNVLVYDFWSPGQDERREQR